MANSAARIFLKNGKSFPQLLRSRLVCRPSSNVNKDQLLVLSQPSTNPTLRLYLQRPMLGDGFNFVDFALGKDRELPREAEVEAREGKMRLASRYDEEEEEEEEGFDDSDDHEDLLDEDSDEYADSDDEVDATDTDA